LGMFLEVLRVYSLLFCKYPFLWVQILRRRFWDSTCTAVKRNESVHVQWQWMGLGFFEVEGFEGLTYMYGL
jgi:hypothetical protein